MLGQMGELVGLVERRIAPPERERKGNPGGLQATGRYRVAAVGGRLSEGLASAI